MTTNTYSVDSGRFNLLSEEILQGSVASVRVEGESLREDVGTVDEVTHFVKTTDGRFLAVCWEGDCHGMVVNNPDDTLEASIAKFCGSVFKELTAGAKITKLT